MKSRNFVVTLKETGEGRPWLLVEPHEDIGLSPNTHITIDLPDGTDIREAQRVASLLNDNLAAFRIKRL